MYCRHCGTEIKGESNICLKCGFEADKGEGKYCSECGKEIKPGQILCTNCGFMISREKTRSVYDDAVRKINIFELVAKSLAVLMLLMLLIAPIYKCEYEDGESISFSLASDIGIVFEEESFAIGIFAVLELVFILYLIASNAYSLYHKIMDYINPDRTVKLTCSRIKRGVELHKPNSFGKMILLFVLLFLILDISVCMGVAKKLVEITSEMGLRDMCCFSGFSGWFVLLVLFAIAYIVLKELILTETVKLELLLIEEPKVA